MVRMAVAIVNVLVMFWQEIDVVKDETVVRVILERFHDTDV